MTIFGFHFHKNEKIFTKVIHELYGRTCVRYDPTRYRMCKECKNIQEYFYDSQGGSWNDLSACESLAVLDILYYQYGKLLLSEDEKK